MALLVVLGAAGRGQLALPRSRGAAAAAPAAAPASSPAAAAPGHAARGGGRAGGGAAGGRVFDLDQAEVSSVSPFFSKFCFFFSKSCNGQDSVKSTWNCINAMRAQIFDTKRRSDRNLDIELNFLQDVDSHVGELPGGTCGPSQGTPVDLSFPITRAGYSRLW